MQQMQEQFVARPWMADMPKMQEHFSAAPGMAGMQQMQGAVRSALNSVNCDYGRN
jgi:hypothetical protein